MLLSLLDPGASATLTSHSSLVCTLCIKPTLCRKWVEVSSISSLNHSSHFLQLRDKQEQKALFLEPTSLAQALPLMHGVAGVGLS